MLMDEKERKGQWRWSTDNNILCCGWLNGEHLCNMVNKFALGETIDARNQRKTWGSCELHQWLETEAVSRPVGIQRHWGGYFCREYAVLFSDYSILCLSAFLVCRWCQVHIWKPFVYSELGFFFHVNPVNWVKGKINYCLSTGVYKMSQR